MALAPTNIQQIGNELAIQWSDGGESYLNLELIRRACPCAACGGEPDVLGNVLRPEVSHTEASFQLDSAVELKAGFGMTDLRSQDISEHIRLAATSRARTRSTD